MCYFSYTPYRDYERLYVLSKKHICPTGRAFFVVSGDLPGNAKHEISLLFFISAVSLLLSKYALD